MIKNKFYLMPVMAVAIIASTVVAKPAAALSCLSVDMYLESVVGDESIVIFTAKSIDQIREKDYTAEVVEVAEVKQGYVENTVFVYHQKDFTWGYLCNAGPKDKKGETSLYVAHKDSFGKLNVYQTLSLTDPLVETLDKNLDEAEINGEKVTLTKTDRLNQIITTITELIHEISILVKEYTYWKN
jgi:hypothetical protein